MSVPNHPGWSVGEISALSAKAARGLELAHGLAEEVGAAIQWLVAQGRPGPEALAEYLLDLDRGVAAEALSRLPVPVACAYRPYCPIALGASLCDLQPWTQAQTPIDLGVVRQPLLLAGLLGRHGWASRLQLSVSTSGWDFLSAGGGHPKPVNWLVAAAACKISPRARTLATRANGATAAGRVSHRVPAESAPAVAQLEAFAARSYAPATEASRLAGAGAGTSDND